MNTLRLYPSEQVSALYVNHSHYNEGDSGIDIFTPRDIEICLGETIYIDLEIKCEMLDKNNNHLSYYLYPRSSFSKTPLILANHVGIIDSGYRGTIKAAVKYVPQIHDIRQVFLDRNIILNCLDDSITDINIIKSKLPKYTIKAGTRLFQICSNDLSPIKLKILDNESELSNTQRGSNSFGSTGL